MEVPVENQAFMDDFFAQVNSPRTHHGNVYVDVCVV